MKFQLILAGIEDVGKHILAGIEKAAPVIAKFAAPVAAIPVVGPALAESATIITAIEQQGSGVTADELAEIIQTISTANAFRAAASGGSQK